MKRILLLLMIAGICTVGPLQVSSAAIQRLSYTALGDSIAFGLWALPGQGYVPQYADYLQSHFSLPVTHSPLGIPGWTSSDLLSALRGNLVFRISVSFSDLVTWNIGGNDLSAARSKYKGKTCGGTDHEKCLQDAVNAFKSNWDGILSQMFVLRRSRPTLFRTMDIYNPFVNQDQAADTWPGGDAGNDFKVLNGYLDQVNSYIASTSTTYHFAYAPVHLWFNGPMGTTDPGDLGLLAFDHFHPSAAGHALIGQLLDGLEYVPIIP